MSYLSEELHISDNFKTSKWVNSQIYSIDSHMIDPLRNLPSLRSQGVKVVEVYGERSQEISMTRLT